MGACVLVLLCGCIRRESVRIAVTPQSSSHTFFVATNGNDQWSGTLAFPNRKKTDGPFVSLPRAVEAVRQLKKTEPTSANPPRVLLHNGTYFLSEPLVLKHEDSALTIGAYQDEKPIVSGGGRITGWKETVVQNKKLWVAEIPEVRSAAWLF